MSRINIVLALLIIASALLLINAQHQARKNFVALEGLQKEARGLDEEWGQLRLEQSTWAGSARIETLARTRLGLINPPLDRIRVESVPTQ